MCVAVSSSLQVDDDAELMDGRMSLMLRVGRRQTVLLFNRAFVAVLVGVKIGRASSLKGLQKYMSITQQHFGGAFRTYQRVDAGSKQTKSSLSCMSEIHNCV